MKIRDMPKLERDNKGRFMKGVPQRKEFYDKAKETRKNTALEKGCYHSQDTKNKIGVANSIALKGKTLTKESIVKRTSTRQNKGWFKNKENYLKKVSGANSWSWRGGTSFEKYGIEFNNSLRNLIRYRDNFQCKNCGKIGCDLYVHHIDYNKKNNKPDNLISLCGSCHSKTNFRRRIWEDLLNCFIVFQENVYKDKWDYVNKGVEYAKIN